MLVRKFATVIAVAALPLFGCDADNASPPEDAPEASDDAIPAADTDGDDNGDGELFDGSSGGAEMDDAQAFDSLLLELAPVFRCDHPFARASVPPHRCRDATPGTEATEEQQIEVTYAFGRGCTIERICGEYWGVDCNTPRFEGPYHYVHGDSLSVITTSADQPPRSWNCPRYVGGL